MTPAGQRQRFNVVQDQRGARLKAQAALVLHELDEHGGFFGKFFPERVDRSLDLSQAVQGVVAPLPGLTAPRPSRFAKQGKDDADFAFEAGQLKGAFQ